MPVRSASDRSTRGSSEFGRPVQSARPLLPEPECGFLHLPLVFTGTIANLPACCSAESTGVCRQASATRATRAGAGGAGWVVGRVPWYSLEALSVPGAQPRRLFSCRFTRLACIKPPSRSRQRPGRDVGRGAVPEQVMCGILGVVGATMDLEPGLRLLRRRGPDDTGTWVDPEAKVSLGHVRLSIIDTSKAGHQPMWSRDRRVVMIYNGEIYNYRELRQELEA